MRFFLMTPNRFKTFPTRKHAAIVIHVPRGLASAIITSDCNVSRPDEYARYAPTQDDMSSRTIMMSAGMNTTMRRNERGSGREASSGSCFGRRPQERR